MIAQSALILIFVVRLWPAVRFCFLQGRWLLGHSKHLDSRCLQGRPSIFWAPLHREIDTRWPNK